MGVIFVDPFDHYTTPSKVYDFVSSTLPTISSTYARFTGATGGNNPQGMHCPQNAYVYKAFGANPGPTNYFLFSARLPTGPATGARGILQIRDTTATAQVTLAVDALGRFQFYRGTATSGTAIGPNSGATLFGTNIWRRLEVKITIDGSAGVVELRMDGSTSPIISASGLNTKASANAYWNLLYIGDMDAGLPSVDYDDLIVEDTSGSVCNGYLGDRKLLLSMPSSDNTAVWAHNTGSSNFGAVKEIPDDGDTTYVSSNTAGQQDWYGIQSVSFTGNADFVALIQMMKKDDASVHTEKGGINSSSATAFTPIYTLASSYLYYGMTDGVFYVDPNTSAAFTSTGVNALLVGPNLVS